MNKREKVLLLINSLKNSLEQVETLSDLQHRIDNYAAIYPKANDDQILDAIEKYYKELAHKRGIDPNEILVDVDFDHDDPL